MPPVARRVLEAPPSATVRIADLAARLRREGKDVLDFSAGRASEHTPDYLCDSAYEAMRAGDTHQTAARGKQAYLRACAEKLARENGLEVDPETEIIATLGCKQGLLLALMATLDPGAEIVVEDPGFVSYQPTIRFCGARPVAVALRREQGFRWSERDLASAVTPSTRAILLCSPHNPTGVVHTVEDLDAIARVANRHDLLVIVDETYERLVWGDREHLSLRGRDGMRHRTIGLMGVTKSFSMGGWRVGFAYGPAPFVSAMVVLQQHLTTCAGSFAQTGAAEAIGSGPPEAVRALWAEWHERCIWTTGMLEGLRGVTCAMPQGGFYGWMDISGTGWPSEELANHLLETVRVALVPGSAFGPHGEGYLRMTCVKSWEDLREGVDRLKAAFANLPAVPA